MMKVELWEAPKKNVIMLEGFPGFGFVGTIATEAIMDHLKPKLIGRVFSDKLPALIAVHDSKLVEPLGIFYDEKSNILITHAVANINGLEWELSQAVLSVASQVKAAEIISLEGIGTFSPLADVKASNKAFYYTNSDEAKKKFESLGVLPLKEGIIVGVTGTLILRAYKQKVSCIFGETHSKLPDSRAAAAIIDILDKYLKLNIPFKPLLKKAEEFEKKIEGIFDKMKTVSDEKQEKEERVGYIT